MLFGHDFNRACPTGAKETPASAQAKAGVQIPIVGVVKNAQHKPERIIGDTKALQAYERDILLANAEAHRFAIESVYKKYCILLK